MEMFAAEAEGIAQAANKHLLDLERAAAGAEATADSYAELARGLHSLKGTSSALGLETLSDLAHRMEDLIAPLRRARLPLPPAAADALFFGFDVFVAHVKAHGQPAAELPSLVEAATRIAQVASGAVLRTAPALQLEATLSWRAEARDVVALIHEVEQLRELRLRLDRHHAEMGRALALAQRDRELRDVLARLRRALVAERDRAAESVAGIEDAVKAICTLPVSQVLDPLARTVRDQCRRTGKRARLSVVGGEVSLDRRLLEGVRGALVQLVRNAVDHGIEPPSERERLGKHGEGALIVRVEEQGNLLTIEVSDDGAGIDLDRVRREALERGLKTTAELEGMSQMEVCSLIFRSGFTTREEVDMTSGRGVGLDVVRAQVSELDGYIEVFTIRGQGTRFVLTLPSELGSSAALVARSGDQVFGIPMNAIEAVVAAHPSKVRASGAGVSLDHQGRLLCVQDLGAMLGLRHAVPPHRGDPVIVLADPDRVLAISVDEILGEAELVVRPLPRELRDLKPYQGAATATSGDLVLVLRARWLLAAAETPRTTAARKVLVVDDSLTARTLHRTILEAGGYLVHTAKSAEQALEQLAHSRYDAIVSDLAMEGMDGIALCRLLGGRSETRGIPVILVSARDDEETRRRALDAGPAAFLTKAECAAGGLLAEVSAVVRGERPS
jgi:chemotaxis protein histidine kinase CheA